jgi:hypothetical protein
MCPDLNHFMRPRGRVPAEEISQQLRGLPAELPPPYDWAEFTRRSRNRFPSKGRLVKWPHAAAAAGLAVFVAGMALLGTGDNASDSVDESPKTAATSDAPSAGQARETREWLSRQPAEPALVRVGPRVAVANLEDRIAWFDDALTNERMQGVTADNVKVLQQERARLVRSLAQVRYAEALAADGS